MWTRSKSKDNKEVLDFKELGTSKRKTLIKSRSLGSINTLESPFKLVPFNLHTRIASKMASLALNIYLAWDNGVPLALVALHDIPRNVLKTLPEFYATIEKIAYEQCVDVVILAKFHNIQHKNVMV